MVFLKKIPIAATPFKLIDIFSIFRAHSALDKFQKELSRYLNSKFIFTINSGTSAFYLILKTLASIHPSKKEVILPAYTAASLILPTERLGLKPVLCDISLKTFNLDFENLSELISEDTLCVVAIHLFGLVCDIDRIKADIRRKNSQAFIIEDCAQALGALAGERSVGSQGDIALYSFNRGKNMSTCCGGAIATNSEELAGFLKKESDLLQSPSVFIKFNIVLKFFLLSLVVNPFIYNVLYSLLKAFRSERPPLNFSILGYSDIQAAVGLSLLKRLEEFSQIRYANGFFLFEALSEMKEVILPQVFASSRPAYNRFPVVFRNLDSKQIIKKKLFKQGIDSSDMYERPLHFIFDLGYKKGDFPNAEYFAQRLLTLPCHPLVTKSSLTVIKEVFKENLNK